MIHCIYSVLCFPAAGPSTAVNPVSTNGLPIEVAGLHMLLNDDVFTNEIVPMVRPTHMNGIVVLKRKKQH